MPEVPAQYKALGEDPQPAVWQDLSLKSRPEFMLCYRRMLEAGVSGPQNVGCMEGLKSMIALASSKPDEKEKRQELLGKIEKSLADRSK